MTDAEVLLRRLVESCTPPWLISDGGNFYGAKAPDKLLLELCRAYFIGKHKEVGGGTAIERDALKAALREATVKVSDKDGFGYCRLCRDTSWAFGEPERHAPGCLAAP